MQKKVLEGGVLDNAGADVEAEEQITHEKTETLKTVVDRNLSQIKRALSAIRRGRYGKCDICGKEIPIARLKVFPAATLCTACRSKREEEKKKSGRKKELLTAR